MQEVKEQEKTIEPTIPFSLYCIECSFRVANKAYESCLVVNPYVLSFSTDEECANVVRVYELYKSKYCSCEIKDNACINCGGIVGYTVLQPCDSCLESQNNGNFIIFYANAVKLGPFDLNSCINEISTEEYLADR